MQVLESVVAWPGGFRLRDTAGGAIVFCDPFLTPNSNRNWQAPVDDAALAQADVSRLLVFLLVASSQVVERAPGDRHRSSLIQAGRVRRHRPSVSK